MSVDVQTAEAAVARASDALTDAIRVHPAGAKQITQAQDKLAAVERDLDVCRRRAKLDEERQAQAKADAAEQEAAELNARCQAALVRAYERAVRMDARHREEADDVTAIQEDLAEALRNAGANRFRLRAAVDTALARYLSCILEPLRPPQNAPKEKRAGFIGIQRVLEFAFPWTSNATAESHTFSAGFRKLAGIKDYPPAAENPAAEIFTDLPPAA